ncbi:MAG: redoxin domain-containing protein [Bacteroidales bacterium]|nr:redoxin domain-containing protein [Bacteroidales bacterium]
MIKKSIFWESAVLIVWFMMTGAGASQEQSKQQLELAPERDISLTVHIRGVFESKISLLPLTGGKALQAVAELTRVVPGDTAIMTIPRENLPGDFVLRFDYKEQQSSTPYPSEKRIVIGSQDLELRAHPMFCNNPDSTRFQQEELENATLAEFMKENSQRKEMLGLLQQFLLYYDDPGSDFYGEGIREYEKRRIAHNKWVETERKKYNKLFVSSRFPFQSLPVISWEESEAERRQSLMDHYFDEVDFNDPLLTRTNEFTEWMNNYVNIYGELATTVALRDSLFVLAGRRSIEQARNGHPLVYGWMVDYFYRGYESTDIPVGIAMLEPYLDDPNCLTTKRQAILKRLEGMETLVPGFPAPDFSYAELSGGQGSFHDYHTEKPYKLVIFWSADCPHCMEMVSGLYPWYLEGDHRNLLDIFALSLDDTEEGIKAWRKTVADMPGWIHILTEGGVNSAEADLYFVLATPVMVLVDAQTHTIVDQPATLDQLVQSIRK